MQKSFWTLLQDGRQYSQTWPLKAELAAVFPEVRIIKATNLAISTMPPLAILSAAIQLQTFGTEFLPQAIATSLFLLSLPIQGLYWLGKRSDTRLPPGMVAWYRDIHDKMRSQGCELNGIKRQPKYKELANLLKRAFTEMDKAFTRDII